MEIFTSYIKPFLTHPLNRRNKFKAVINFIRWQFLLRHAKANNSYIIAPYITGLRCIVKKGMHGITGNLYSGLLDFNEMGLLIHFLREEDLFFDIGANVGIYTLLASGLKGAQCHSFEPVPETFSILKGNIVLNNLEAKTRLYNVGVGLEEGIVEFSTDVDTENSVVTSDYGGEKTQINIINLDTKFAHEINQCTMIKIDTEGFEDKVLAGAVNILSNINVKIIVVEMNKPEYVKKFLKAAGFLPYTYDAISRTLLQTDYNAGNMIFIRDAPFVMNRISSAGRTEIRKGQFI